MNTSHTVLDQTNPVYNTAKLTLSILGNAGVKEASEYAERLGFTELRKEFLVNEQNNSDLPQAIIHESRYAFLNRCVRESGCKNVVDIACGFSPRGYVLAKEGYNYLGVDLEASVAALNALAKDFEGEEIPGTFRYEACDLTDPVKFEKLLSTIDGELIIICEGLFMYLQPYEAQSLFEGIRNVLKQHGGQFITGDFMFSDIYVGVHISLLGQEEGMKALMKMANATAQKSDTTWSDTLVANNGSPRAVELLKKLGFDLAYIPFYTADEEMHVWERMDLSSVERVSGTMSQMVGWSVTLNAEHAVSAAETVHIPFEVKHELQGKTLKYYLSGRVDSTTSTDLLNDFNAAKESEDFDTITVDMSHLTYISSAGLRVLLIMKKALKDGDITCSGLSSEVVEIFETTGFDTLIRIQ